MSELAKYKINFEVEGMAVDGMPPGAGDRRLAFEIDFDASDPDMADALWYEHLKIIFGSDQVEKMQEFARQVQRKR